MDQHATITEYEFKIEQLGTEVAGLKVENLNAHEIIKQMSTAQADQAAASSAKPADPDEADGGDDPCRRPTCVKLAAELDEARNRFKQTAKADE